MTNSRMPPAILKSETVIFIMRNTHLPTNINITANKQATDTDSFNAVLRCLLDMPEVNDIKNGILPKASTAINKGIKLNRSFCNIIHLAF